MKPSAKPGAPAAPSREPAASQMAEELQSIDTQPLDRLLGIRKEEAQLEEFRTRAEQMKDKVQDVVWRRVVSDYTRRGAALEEQATPLKVQVRVEYQKLRVLLDRTKAESDAAELEKSELEFRHAVGELTKKQLDDQLTRPVDVLERCRVDLGAIEELKTRFLSAFGSESEMETPPAPVAPPPAAPTPPAPAPKPAAAPSARAEAPKPAPAPRAPEPAAAAPAPPAAAPPPAPTPPRSTAAAEPEPDVTMLAVNPLLQGTPPAAEAPPAAPPSPASKAPPPAPVIEPDVTSIVSAEQVAAMTKAAKDAAADESGDRTFMLPVAGLLVNVESPTPSEYRLAAMNYLGRSDESHVVIARPGVSRKHALIVAGLGGFNIKDLESQNGTFVNGQRITEQPLQDGDQIVIGDTKIIFRTPWPVTAAAASS